MTNLTVLRSAQHAGWQGYCWPFSGNGFPVTAPPSPAAPSMANPSPCRPASPAHITAAPSSYQLQRLSRAYEEHLLQFTAAAAAASAVAASAASHTSVKMEPLSPDPLPQNSSKGGRAPRDANPATSGKNKQKHSRSSPSHSTPTSVAANKTPSPAVSPKSQNSARTKTPISFPGTPPHSSFTPPTAVPPGCFNPTSYGGLGTPTSAPMTSSPRSPHFMEPPSLPRNCSDLMRSLAAKYNNNNNNELFSSQMSKSFARGGLNPRVPGTAGYSSPLNASPRSDDSLHDGFNLSKASPAKLFSPFLPHSPMNDMYQSPVSPRHSSAAALMDLVRNSASATSSFDVAPHNLSSSVKRYADTSPLDLSSSDSAKKMRRDSSHQASTFSPLTLVEPISSIDFEKNIPDVRLSPDVSRSSQKFCSHSRVRNVSESRSDVPDVSKHISYPSMLKASPLPDKRLSSSTGTADTMLETPQKDCNPNASSAHPAVLAWSMQDVCAFVRSIDLCAEYADMFLDERIDGWCLSLLTESHLTGNLGMKLGPALKLRSMLASVSSMPCDGRTVYAINETKLSAARNIDGPPNLTNVMNNFVNVSTNNNEVSCKAAPNDRISNSSLSTELSPFRNSRASPATPSGEPNTSSPTDEE